MGAHFPADEPEGPRYRDLFNVDEFINFVMTKAGSRTGRRVITGACFVAVSAVVIYPIVSRSAPAPADQGDASSLSISELDDTTTTDPPIEIPDFPIVTAPPTTTPDTGVVVPYDPTGP
jgi:hypothetical protein